MSGGPSGAARVPATYREKRTIQKNKRRRKQRAEAYAAAAAAVAEQQARVATVPAASADHAAAARVEALRLWREHDGMSHEDFRGSKLRLLHKAEDSARDEKRAAAATVTRALALSAREGARSGPHHRRGGTKRRATTDARSGDDGRGASCGAGAVVGGGAGTGGGIGGGTGASAGVSRPGTPGDSTPRGVQPRGQSPACLTPEAVAALKRARVVAEGVEVAIGAAKLAAIVASDVSAAAAPPSTT